MNIEELLNQHIAEDGTLDVAKASEALKKELPKHYTPKEEFNNKNDQLKEAQKTIKTLQDANQDNADLQATIDQYKADNERLEAENKAIATRAKATEKLHGLGVTDVDYALFKLGDIELDVAGELKDFEAKFNAFKEAHPTFVKSDEDPEPTPGAGIRGAQPVSGNPTPNPVNRQAQLAEEANQSNQAAYDPWA